MSDAQNQNRVLRELVQEAITGVRHDDFFPVGTGWTRRALEALYPPHPGGLPEPEEGTRDWAYEMCRGEKKVILNKNDKCVARREYVSEQVYRIVVEPDEQ